MKAGRFVRLRFRKNAIRWINTTAEQRRAVAERNAREAAEHSAEIARKRDEQFRASGWPR
jgi:hypothetical protein